MRSARFILVILSLAGGLQFFATNPVTARDIILRNGTIIDGSKGTARYKGDVLVRNDSIAEVGNFDSTQQKDAEIIDISGLIVTPGFIDVHNHSAGGLDKHPEATSQVTQGITTAVLGPDGASPYPLAKFLARVEKKPAGMNIMLMVGHGTVRNQILKRDYKRLATASEVKRMCELVEQEMRSGAYGLSSGLEYDPGFYSNTEEVISLSAVAAKYGGLYMTHSRDEGDKVLDSIAEAIRIGREAKLPVQISHIKMGTTAVWGKAREALAKLNECKDVDVTADLYPYIAWCSSLSVLVPSRKFTDKALVDRGLSDVGGAANVLITNCPKQHGFEFQTLQAIAEQRKITPTDLFIELMKEGNPTIVCSSMKEDDVKQFLKDDKVMVASDGGIDSRHPRGAGTFPRVLAKYVRVEGVVSLENAIYKMTGFPAQRFSLADRGLLKKGNKADIVVFDPEHVKDNSTFQDPFALSEGIKYVLVNGVFAVKNGTPTRARSGVVLRKH